MKNKYAKRGQIAQEAMISFIAYTLFIIVLLAALNHTLPQIQQKQENEMQKQINNYRCTNLDLHAALKSTGIRIDLTNIDKLKCMSNPDGSSGPRQFEFHRELD